MTRRSSIRDSKAAVDRGLNISPSDAATIVKKGIEGGEIRENGGSTGLPFDSWLSDRFLPNCVTIDDTSYAHMCIDALKIVCSTTATDYGSSRQRDLSQLWADMTRGYLGEYAVSAFLKQRYGIEVGLGHERGDLKEYLPTDIRQVKTASESAFRAPRLAVGIKSVKWNGIWFDIWGNQFSHSDVHILVKAGVGRDHLFAFFKSISVFKDKVLARGREINCISSDEANSLFDSLPNFSPIPAYVCGFVPTSAIFTRPYYSGKKGRKHYTVCSWNGPINSGLIHALRATEKVSGDVKFKGIGVFTHVNGHLFTPGGLLWQDSDWRTHVIDRL